MHIININHGNHSHSWPSTCEDNKSYLHRIATKNRLNWWGNMCLQRALTTSSVAVAFCHRLPQTQTEHIALTVYFTIWLSGSSSIPWYALEIKHWYQNHGSEKVTSFSVWLLEYLCLDSTMIRDDSRLRGCVWNMFEWRMYNTEYYAPTSKDCRGGSYLLSKQKSRIP